MPSPNGPSRSTVGGTMPQPLACDTANAATSRRGERAVREVVERPLAHDRLVDARRDEVGLRVGAAARREAQEGVVRRRPQPPDDRQLALGQQVERDGLGQDRHRQAEIVDRLAVPSSSSVVLVIEAVVIDAIEIDGLELVPVVHVVAADPVVQPVAVAPRAEVALRVERLAAQRARRAARGEHPQRPADERPRGERRHPDAQQVRAVIVVVVEASSSSSSSSSVCSRGLEEHEVVLRVPAERQRAGPERLVDRLVEGRRIGVERLERAGALDAAALQLVEQLVEALDRGRRPGPSRGRPRSTRVPSRAWRKKVRLPGSPTVPATKRSGVSKR